MLLKKVATTRCSIISPLARPRSSSNTWGSRSERLMHFNALRGLKKCILTHLETHKNAF